MEKLTLEEFWNSKEKIAIHCDTRQKAKKLLKAFDKMGMKWNGGERYTSVDFYYEHGHDTCYANNHRLSSYKAYEKFGCKIYEYDEIDDILLKEVK